MGFLIQLCQHSSDTTDLFLPRNSKSFSDISVTERICFLTLYESKAKPNHFDHGLWGLHAFPISREKQQFTGVYVVFRCGCEAVFHWNGVLYKNSDQLWLFHCINVRRVFGSTLNPRPRAKTTFSSLCK